MKIINSRFTSFLCSVFLEDGYIFLEKYDSDFAGKAFLYRVDRESNLIWEASVSPHLIITDLFIEDGEIKVTDSTGTSRLDPDTGKLTDKGLSI